MGANDPVFKIQQGLGGKLNYKNIPVHGDYF